MDEKYDVIVLGTGLKVRLTLLDSVILAIAWPVMFSQTILEVGQICITKVLNVRPGI